MSCIGFIGVSVHSLCSSPRFGNMKEVEVSLAEVTVSHVQIRKYRSSRLWQTDTYNGRFCLPQTMLMDKCSITSPAGWKIRRKKI